MKFHDPAMLWHLLWAGPAIAFFLFWAERSYRRASARFAEKQLIGRLAPSNINWRRIAKVLLDLGAIILIVLALARPQWGLAWKQKTPAGVDILFAVDLSKSMLATDIAPDRLSYTKQEVRAFVERLTGDRTGLIGFSGKSFLFCPMTPDHGGFLLTLDGMESGSVPRGGTSIASAIDEAVKALSSVPSDEKVLILISDGEETEGNARAAAAAAKEAHVQINCIGIGTSGGGAITYVEENGAKAVVRDSAGAIVRSKLDEDVLKAVAETTGGIYVRARADDFGLEKIYDERISKMKKRQADESLSRSYEERYQYPLALGLLFLCASIAISMSGGHEKE